ncbi:transposase [Deinococcus peraridilitoris]|uniref:transposase n=1 Tax=Deinococcus peraridilitoris TaxID=432329 RepID=UPI0002FF927E|nr:transposase [Deinococcus peraridilitoris]
MKLSELVCLDESGFNSAMTRRYARAPRGERADAQVPRNHEKNLTLLCALSLSGPQAELVIEGAVNAQVFETYVREVLCPTLQPGQTGLMDNLASHKAVVKDMDRFLIHVFDRAESAQCPKPLLGTLSARGASDLDQERLEAGRRP